MRRFLAVLLAGLAVMAGPVAADDPVTDDLALIEKAGFAPEDVGYLVIDLDDQRVVAEYNADRPFIPASVAKVPAIAAALEILGGDHRFKTTVLSEGEVVDGVLTGTLILRGGGDPFLAGDDLKAMARALAASGIKKVDGAFLFDATALIELPQISDQQPEAAGYNTGVSALALNFNRVRLRWKNSGDAPSADALAVSDTVTVPVKGIGLAFAKENLIGPIIRAGAVGEDRWLLSPKISEKGEDWLPVVNPSRITAEAFHTLAAAEGVDLPEPMPGATPDGAHEVIVHESLPLSEIARGILRYSNNLSAELVGLAASLNLTGQTLTLADSGNALGGWWALRVPEADWTGLALENHSGLTSNSRTTPRQIVAMLQEAAAPVGGADFHDLLKEISWKGVKGSARIKTGTMSYARGLAGYIDTAADNRLAFAIFFNDIEKRAALDAAFDPRVKAIDPKSRSWRNRALVLERTLTSTWAKEN